MKKTLFFISIAISIFFIGCDKTKYYEPKEINGRFDIDQKLPSAIKNSSREGAILKDNTFLTKNGLANIKLTKGTKFFATDGRRYLLQNECTKIILLDSKAKEMIEIPSSNCLASGNVFGNKIAALYIDNTIALLDIPSKKEEVLDSFTKAIANTSLIAKPEFAEKLVVYPTLNGKIMIYDVATQKVMRDISIGTEKFFNNISYLKILDNGTILAATNKRITSILGNSVYNFDANLRDVIYHDNYIYALLNSGEIYKLDMTLKPIRRKKFPFAILSGIVISKNKLYTSEKKGYMIELDINTFISKVYKNSYADEIMFYTDKAMYLGKYYKEF